MTPLNPPILLTESETLQETIDCLRQHIPLETQGAFNASDLYQILVRAASNCDSIENTSKSLKKATCGKNIRYHLDKINDFEELETNRAILGYPVSTGGMLTAPTPYNEP